MSTAKLFQYATTAFEILPPVPRRRCIAPCFFVAVAPSPPISVAFQISGALSGVAVNAVG